MTNKPSISIIIPVYNESEILRPQLRKLERWLINSKFKYEIVIAENGSTDGSDKMLDRWAKKQPQQRTVLHSPIASFGRAVKLGIVAAKNEYSVLLNMDWIELGFISQALPLLQNVDIVVGSKVLDPKSDHRPTTRKLLSRLLTAFIHFFFKFHGSDSHGPKAFHSLLAKQIIDDCTCNELIETEFLIRARSAGLSIEEVPVSVSEIRPPRIGLTRRSWRMMVELIGLYKRLVLKKPKRVKDSATSR